jgi:hypothetical protein
MLKKKILKNLAENYIFQIYIIGDGTINSCGCKVTRRQNSAPIHQSAGTAIEFIPRLKKQKVWNYKWTN